MYKIEYCKSKLIHVISKLSLNRSIVAVLGNYSSNKGEYEIKRVFDKKLELQKLKLVNKSEDV